VIYKNYCLKPSKVTHTCIPSIQKTEYEEFQSSLDRPLIHREACLKKGKEK
jgi:hypothetical protein